MPLLSLPLLALQGFADVLGNPATAWVVIPMLIFAIPILQYLLAPVNNAIKAGERERQRRMFERLALERLDIIKTAVALGHSQQDLQALDAQLERAIGADAMRSLLDGKAGSKQAKPGTSFEGAGGTKTGLLAAERNSSNDDDDDERQARGQKSMQRKKLSD